MEKTTRKKVLVSLPVLPLRGLLVFPHMVLHFDAGRAKSIAALQQAMSEDRLIFLATQVNDEVEDPSRSDLYRIGVVARIKQILNLPGENVRVLVEGQKRATLVTTRANDEYMIGVIRECKEEAGDPTTAEALVRTARGLFETYCGTSMRVSQETFQSVTSVEEPGRLSDTIAANVLSRMEDKIAILQEPNPEKRLEALCTILNREIELAETEKRIQETLKKNLDKSQKDYYLREQIRAIQTELGDKESTDVDDLRKALEQLPLNEEARQKATKELDRLEHMAPGTPEVGISRTWVEWLCDMPWGKYTTDNLNLKHARTVLDSNHYGLEKVKERIIEYLAVLNLKKDLKGPILCFVGPPGVGKTSIVRDIAAALGREFVQMSLGGVRDEAEIRGHRRTYVGAIPGRIISGMKQAKTMNPVFLFDEIDKMASDFRGDPASAMLEVLDSQQNFAFRDHYMDIPFDLSHVMFITTANSEDTIPAPLLDRLEIIEVPSYTEAEKLQIAKKHLLSRQITEHGLKTKSIRISDSVMKKLIEGYTREAGVRELDRVLARVARKAAVETLENGSANITVNDQKLQQYLGAPRFMRESIEKEPMIGIVNGLAYTTVGGELLTIECMTMQGSGALQLTGKLGEVMQESGKAAMSWVRANAESWGIPAEYFKQHDFHIHVPEGAVPKDGPSAGVTLTTALVSAVCGIPVKQNIAMTGEMTLRGRVLPIGGLKEKLMAAYREGIKLVLIPLENVKDLEDVDKEVLEHVEIRSVSVIGEVLAHALTASLPKGKSQKTEVPAEILKGKKNGISAKI